MRNLHLYALRTGNFKSLVQGPNAAAPITQLRETQGDTLTIYVHELAANPSTPAIPQFIERPLQATGVRASVGYIDAAPLSGTFRLKVGDQTSIELTWPNDLSSSEAIAAWKTTVLNALKALSNVGTNAVRLDDPPNTPAHIFYFTWTDEERTDPIEVVSNRLLPWTEPTVEGSASAVGYTQQVKLARFPIRMSGSFQQAETPPVTVVETRAGTSGTNAEQTVVIPAGAAGSFSLTWSGSKTKTMAVDTLTAAQLAVALNAIVADGESNPSFRVEQRTQKEGKRFAVEFIGPLAAAAQSMLGVTMHDQQGAPWWTGSLWLGGLALEMALNGAANTQLTFELVITSDGEDTYLLPITIDNDMTSDGTAGAAEELGAVYTVEREVVIDESSAEPFATMAAGASYTPPGALTAGSALTITHNLDSPNVRAWVLRKTATSPDAWEELQLGGEFRYRNISANQTRFWFTVDLTTTSSDDWYREKIKIFVASPDAITQIFGDLKLAWSKVLESVPGGMSVAEKFAAIDNALGIVGGTLQINASQIVGILNASQINIASIVTALGNEPTFATMLQQLFTTNTTLIDAIGGALVNSTSFASTLTSLFANSTVINALVEKLLADPAYATSVKDLVYAILQGGGNLPEGSTAMFIPAFELLEPSFDTFAGPTIKSTITAEKTTTTPDGSGNTVTLKTLEPVEVNTPSVITRYHLLSPAVVSYADDGTKTGRLTTTTTGKLWTVSGSAFGLGAEQTRQTFRAGTKITYANGHYYEVTEIGSVLYPAILERTLALVTINAAEFYQGSRFSLDCPVIAQLQGKCAGRIEFVIEIGAFNAASPGSNLSTITWTEVTRKVEHVSPVAKSLRFGVVLDHTSGGYAGKVKIASQASDFTSTPASALTSAAGNLAVRLRMTKGDPENANELVGAWSVRAPSMTASIVKL